MISARRASLEVLPDGSSAGVRRPRNGWSSARHALVYSSAGNQTTALTRLEPGRGPRLCRQRRLLKRPRRPIRCCCELQNVSQRFVGTCHLALQTFGKFCSQSCQGLDEFKPGPKWLRSVQSANHCLGRRLGHGATGDQVSVCLFRTTLRRQSS